MDNRKTLNFGGKQWQSIELAASVTGYCLPHLRRLCQAGKIPARKVGHRWFLDLETYLGTTTVAPAVGGVRDQGKRQAAKLLEDL